MTNKIRDFLQRPYDTERFKGFIKQTFDLKDFELQEDTPSPQQAFQNSIIQAAIPIYEGKLNHDEDSGLTFRIYSFEVNSINARKAIQDELSNFVRSPAILACFYSPRDTSAFRLSLITRSIDEEGKLTPNSFRRQSFILGENQKIKTALTQLSALKKPTFDSLKEAFSLEPVTKEFFEKITLHFEEIASALTFPDGIKDIDRAHRFTLRFISRILFCKFLEKKGIIPESLLSSPQSFKPDFYASILEPLFFSTLNAPKEERQALDSVFFSIPYLNGGLFSPQEEDYQGKMQIPDAVLEKFLKMLGEFNFTTDESTLNDQEIALDPEMLGKVFEGLLSKISGEEKKAKPAKAESKTNQRKQTGSFYTPREIVDHMVKSSIFTYLKHKQLTSDQALKEFIFEHKCPFSKDSIPHIIEALKAFKVIDPACGSGAFSIGMLNEMCALLEILDPNAETFKQSSEKNSKSPSYTRKLFILKNNIFGVDIQPMAIEIARLRCFLSLIIDEDKDNISPLPNIDINIKCGNSLVSNFELEEHDGLGNPKYHTLAWLIRKDSSFSNNFKEQMKQYKHNVALYKEALGDKKHITQSITKIKDFFRESLLRVSPINEEIDKKLGNFVRTYGDASFDLGSDFGLEMKKRIARKATFAFQPNLQPNSKPKPIDKKGQELFDSLYKDYQELESLRHSQTFEWRFELPEFG